MSLNTGFENKIHVAISKMDDEQRIVFGEVYAPAPPDSQNDFMTASEIQAMAYDFIRKGHLSRIDVNHSREPSGSYVVESFIAREGDLTFIPGAWVLAVHIPDSEIWAKVKSGELNGFSLDGSGVSVDTQVTLILPEILTGRTLESEGHDHVFVVTYDSGGNFVGGFTLGPADHFHQIVSGTVTEESGSPMHVHRFSYVEGVINASVNS